MCQAFLCYNFAIIIMKYLLAAIVLFNLAMQPAKPPEGSRTAKSEASQVGKQAQAGNTHDNPPKDTSLPTQTFVSQTAPQSSGQDAEKSDAKAQLKTQQYIVIFTGALAVVGCLQIVLMFMQWRIMRRQTVLQEAPFRQWLVIEKWHAHAQHLPDGTGNLEVGFNLVNRTKAPLTLESYTLTIAGERSWSKEHHSIAPDNHHYIAVVRQITDVQLSQRDTAGLHVPVILSIAFRDSLERMEKQQFSGWLICNKQMAVFRPQNRPKEMAAQ